MRKNSYFEYLIYAGMILFLFVMFHWSPLAGDDWIYASEVRYSNVLEQTIYAYMTWSGRVLSEFWGFVYTEKKLIWEITGPLLMALTVMLGVRLKKEHHLTDVLLSVFLIMTVPHFIRTQTYTFAVGFAAYYIPIPLYLLHLILLRDYLLENKKSTPRVIVMAVLSFLIPLHMENMSVLLAFTNLAALVYALYRKTADRTLWILLGMAVVSCLIMFLSPGTAMRLDEDFDPTQTLGIGRIIANWKPFLHLSLYYADAIHTVLSAAAIAVLMKDRNSKADLIASAVFAVHLILVWTDGFGNALIDTVWLVLYYGALTYLCLKQASSVRELSVFLIMAVIVSNGIMVFSPSFPERTAVYAVYCLIWIILLLKDNISVTAKGNQILAAALCAGILAFGLHWYRIYHTVHLVNIVRQAQVEYYQKRPDAGDAWFLAYPKKSIHSANIDYEEDVDHIRGFQDYFYLSHDLNLKFYYIDEYTAEAIFAEMPQE